MCVELKFKNTSDFVFDENESFHMNDSCVDTPKIL